MHSTYRAPEFAYEPCREQISGTIKRHPVVIVGAGPTGLTAAIDLARQGVPAVLLDDDCTVSSGSRAICFAKRTLEIWGRLQCVAPMIAKGVVWNTGKLFYDDRLIYSFDLLPEEGHQHPAFINLQQYYVEQYLIDHLRTRPEVELRWKNHVVGVEPTDDCVRLEVDTPDGCYGLECKYLIAADGARSAVRRLLGLETEGRVFQSRFLIVDVVMKAEFPAERWFWFNPPFHRGWSALLHRQADNVWRIDFQLGPDADPDEERKPERVIPRIEAMLGRERPFELEWVSVYTFRSHRMERFRHGRVLFAGDAAHVMSPFGARGANSGVQDADNLAWKLKLVIEGQAPDRLLDSYSDERVHAADENLRHSNRSTDFLSPKSGMAKVFRDAVLELAGEYPFARPLINSGRLSTPTHLRQSPLNTADADEFGGPMGPGSPCVDAPIRIAGRDGWFLEQVGDCFRGVLFAEDPENLPAALAADLLALAAQPIAVKCMIAACDVTSAKRRDGLPCLDDPSGLLWDRYDARDGTFYLLRPDQHVCARFRRFEAGRVRSAVVKACCLSGDQGAPFSM